MLKTPGGTKTLHGCTGLHKMNEIGNYQGECGTSMPKMNVVLSPLWLAAAVFRSQLPYASYLLYA